jgi:cytochrome c biogenesis protein ResB
MNPEPKRFTSTIEINSDNKTTKLQLAVNKPHNIQGWKLYQMSYDVEKGKSSQISVLEAVKDPWLPLVYTGFFLVLAGSVYLFWKGRNLT